MVNELYRQLFHLSGGLFAATAAFFLSQKAFLWLFGVIFVLGCIILFLLSAEFKWFFAVLERDHVAFRGKGAVFYGLGVLLTGILFWNYAGMALLVLAISDAAATLVGTMFISPALPYNHRKTILGSVAFFFAASLVLSFRYPILQIFFIVFLLTALESFDYREIPFLDDNLVIPLVTGYLLSLL